MIRSVPTNASFTFRRRMGAAGAIAAFNPISAGISVGVGLASTAINTWMNSIQLSHNADTATTLIVNGLEQQLKNLDAAYFAEVNPSCADQRAALDAYDNAWAWLQSPAACGAPSYGSAGNRCISDRVPGGKYPWQTYYRDPIATDPRMANLGCDTGQAVLLPSLTTGTYVNAGITSTGGSSTSGLTAAQIAAAALTAAGTPPAAIATPADPAATAAPSNALLYAGLAAGLAALYLVTQ